MGSSAFVVVVGHGPGLEREDGAANVLRGLGAAVKTLDLWDEPERVAPTEGQTVRAVVVEAMARPDLAAAALRSLRSEPSFAAVGAIVAVAHAQVAQLDPASGFDDFVLIPYVPAELYTRVRNVEWRLSEFANEERVKIGAIVIDRFAHEVALHGKPVALTAREMGLLLYLCDRRGRVVSRDEALGAVWGDAYDGGQRTVDIHVRRLRAKLGSALPLNTVRGAGYKVSVPRGSPEGIGDG